MAGIDMLFVSPYINSSGAHLLNNTLLWLASFLSGNGLQTRIVDMNRGSLEGNREKLREHLRRHRPRFVAVSGRWWDSLYGACDVARVVKEYDPKVITVTGGETAGHFAAELCRRPEFDVVFRGKSELPLLHLVQGKPLMNCVSKQGGTIREHPVRFYHTAGTIEEILLQPLPEILDDPDEELGVAPYVWLGDGCPYDCIYCTNASSAQRDSPNGPGRILYRSAEAILNDLEQLGRYRDVFFFDFEHASPAVLEEVIRNIPPKRFGLIYEPWSRLGNASLVDRLTETFTFCNFIIDPQVFSEALREKLAARGWIKPFVSNDRLEEFLERICRAENAIFHLSGLCGLPFEEPRHVEEGDAYRSRLFERFPAMSYSFVLPLMIEPGSPINRNPGAASAVILRKTFDEYLDHSFRNVFSSPVIWWDKMAEIVFNWALDPKPEHVEAFNEYCGVYIGEDPARSIDHTVMSAANPSNPFRLALEPFKPGEIDRFVSDGTVRYRIDGNGRALHNLATVAREIKASEPESVEIDLRDCAWVVNLPRTVLIPPNYQSIEYLHRDPTLSDFLRSAERKDIDVRFLVHRKPSHSFLDTLQVTSCELSR